MSGEMNSTQATLWVFLRLPLLLRLRPAAPCSALTWSSIVLLASPRSSSPFTEMYWTRPFPLGAGGGEGTHPSMPPLKILYFFSPHGVQYLPTTLLAIPVAILYFPSIAGEGATLQYFVLFTSPLTPAHNLPTGSLCPLCCGH